MMKKLLLTFATGAFLATGSVAQTNLDCETWTGIECDGWGSINSFTLLGAPQTLFEETTDVGEGSSSAKIMTGYWLGATAFGASSDTVSGFLTQGGPPTGQFGVPYTDKPTSIDLWIKADLEVGDTGAVFIQLSRTETDSSQDVIAQSLIALIDSSGWIAVNAPLAYFNALTPDTLQIICVSSMGSLFGGMPLPIIGSVIYVDGFVINVPVGIGEERDEDVSFSVYPNPASEYFVIKNNSSKSKMAVEMTDMGGKVVRSYSSVTGGELTLTTEGLANGSYMIKVTSGGKQVIRQVIVQ